MEREGGGGEDLSTNQVSGYVSELAEFVLDVSHTTSLGYLQLEL